MRTEDQFFHVVVIDDDPTQLERVQVFCDAMDRPRVRLFTTPDPTAAVRHIEQNSVDLVLTDNVMPKSSGDAVLERVMQINPSIPVVIMTAYGSTEDAVGLLKKGAADYLVKPTSKTDIERLFIRISEASVFARENATLQETITEYFGSDAIMYKSRVMAETLNVAARSAKSKATVLISGESGVGKELVARLIHFASPRSEKPFVTVNIAALPETLIESELFGHRKGAFTGASDDRVGRFEQAHTGTIFIDEVGDVPAAVQVKLLRAIQFGEIERVGENATRKLDVRIIAATNRDLKAMAESNRFRSDLYYRLNVIPVVIPPLRDRRIDVPRLVEHFIATFSERNEKHVEAASREAMDLLMKYRYPGNVRELENIIESAVVMCRGSMITVNDLPPAVRDANQAGATGSGDDPGGGASYDAAMRTFEIDLIARAVRDAGGNRSEAARALGVTERKIRSRLERLGIESKTP